MKMPKQHLFIRKVVRNAVFQTLGVEALATYDFVTAKALSDGCKSSLTGVFMFLRRVKHVLDSKAEKRSSYLYTTLNEAINLADNF